jgi:general secretion pathway protein D
MTARTRAASMPILQRPRRVGLAALLLAILLAAAPTPFSPTAAAAQTAGKGETYLFAFQDAEIIKVVQEILDGVGASYTIDPAVSGRMSLRIDQRLTRLQVIEALDAALSVNGVSMVRDNDRLMITPTEKARGVASVKPYREDARRVGYEIVAVPLAFGQPSEVTKALEAIAGKSLLILPYDRLGLVVLGGGGQDLESALETIKVFDQNVFADGKLRWFQLNQAAATTVAPELERLFQGSGAAGVAVIPLKRLNGVVVFGRSQDVLDQARKWVQQLDVADGQGASSLWVYHPHHTSAEALARTLSAVMSADSRVGAESGLSQPAAAVGTRSGSTDLTNASTSGNASDATGRVTVDKESNTLFITGAASDWVKAQKILAEIDRLPGQVLVEASIVEVTLTNDLQFGVDWSVLSGDFQVSSINNSSGTVGPSAPGGSITFLHGNIQAAVSALGSVANIQVVSAPKIIVMDSKTARLQIGDQVPVVSQSAQSTSNGGAPVINSIDYRSTGVILSVTPRISGDNQITLEVNQEVSSVAKTMTSGIDSPTIQQRKFESALILRSGGVVALGGLINSNVTQSNSGVPGLRSLPGVGSLFRSNGRSQTRTELIVLMSAKIMRDEASATSVMSDLFQDMLELQRRGLLPTRP